MARKKKKPLPKIGKRIVKNDFEYKTYLSLLGSVKSIDYEGEKFGYRTDHTYLPDFKIETRKGKYIFIETKGNGRAFDQSVRVKMIAVKEQHPDIDLRILFYSDGKIGPKRKDGSFLKQSDWAKKHNFTFAIRDIPEEWLNE